MIESMRTLKVYMDYAAGRQRPASASWPPLSYCRSPGHANSVGQQRACRPCAAAAPGALGGAGRGAMGLGQAGMLGMGRGRLRCLAGWPPALGRRRRARAEVLRGCGAPARRGAAPRLGARAAGAPRLLRGRTRPRGRACAWAGAPRPPAAPPTGGPLPRRSLMFLVPVPGQHMLSDCMIISGPVTAHGRMRHGRGFDGRIARRPAASAPPARSGLEDFGLRDTGRVRQGAAGAPRARPPAPRPGAAGGPTW